MLAARQVDFRQVFNSEAGQRVLADLAKFCFANESTFHADPRAHAFAEGRREVFLRIQHQLKLTNEQVWALYGRKDLTHE